MEFNSEISTIILSFFTAFIVTYFSIPTIVRVARTKHLFDEPDERSSHTTKTPTLGGLAIFGGLVISSGLWVNQIQLLDYQYIIAALIIVFFIGIKDDILIIAPITKFSGQMVASLIIIAWGGIRITNFHGFFGIHEVNYFISFSITMLTILVIINGFNFIDGVDGLSASIGIVTSSTFAVFFYQTGHIQYVILSLALVGALFAFFLFNVFGRENKIFMGDTGSLIIGLILSVLVIKFNQINIDKSSSFAIYPAPAVSFGILIIPLFDLLRVVFIRLVINRPILKPDKNHLHHQLIELGLRHSLVTLIITLVNIFFICFVFYTSTIFSIRRLLLLILILAMFLSYIPPYLIGRKNKKLSRANEI
jgi:UDP-N-acetylmuramyl pentapeptide phosphotransferase/UDP-N-acetylglucosamine-1-phosphate transferase